MARITRKLFPDTALTIFTIEGSASPQEMLETVAKLPEGERTRDIIWDATAGTVGSMRYQDMKFIAESLRSGHSHGLRPQGRTALVAGSALDYGMARMFATCASLKGLTVTYKCFRDLDDAMAWLEDTAAGSVGS